MSPVETGTRTVPRASLCHEVRRSGPLPPMLPGAPAGPRVFTALAGQLADHYTGVTHDIRSPLKT
jgi:hypothetical protein